MKKLLIFLFFILLSFNFLYPQPAFFSVQTHFGQFYRPDMDTAQVRQMLDLIESSGIKAIRDEVYWSDIEKAKGVFEFPDNLDYYIREARIRNLDVLLILDYNNPLYANSPNSGIVTDSNRIAFANYCRKVVERYYPIGVRNFEVWNEPNIPIFWSPAPDADEYCNLLRVVYPIIKSYKPDINIIACATSPAEGEPAPFISGIDFISRVFALGGADYMDAVSFHQYHVDSPPENYLFREIDRLRQIVGDQMPIWLTEVGYPTNSGWPNITLELQAKYLPRLFLLGRTLPQLQRISYYDFKNDGTDSSDPEQNFGILNYDLSPKPSFYSLKAAATLVGDATFVQKLPVSAEVLKFGTGDSTIYALWSVSGTKNIGFAVEQQKYEIISQNGDIEAYRHIGRQTLSVQAEETVKYVRTIQELPPINLFQFPLPRIILFTDQTFLPQIKCESFKEKPIYLDNSVINWMFSGKSAYFTENFELVSPVPDSGNLIAEYNEFSDTMEIKVVNRGNYLLESFESSAESKLAISNLDSAETKWTISNEQSSHGRYSGKLQYQFSYDSHIPRQNYRADILTFITIPGKSDSLVIDVFGDSTKSLLEFHFIDCKQQKFTKKLYNSPISWKNQWRAISLPFSSLRGDVKYPVCLTQISIYCATSPDLINGAVYRGTLYFDNLHSKISTVSEVAQTEKKIEVRQLDFKVFPNPSNSRITVQFSSLTDKYVLVELFNLLGQKKFSLKRKSSGLSHLQIDLSELSSGIHFMKIKSGDQIGIKKILVMK